MEGNTLYELYFTTSFYVHYPVVDMISEGMSKKTKVLLVS